MTTGMTRTANVDEIAKGLVQVLETYQGAEEVFATDAFFDVNVPTWRFQLETPDAFVAWLQEFCPDGYRISARTPLPTASGFVIEVEGEYSDDHGAALFFRNLYVCAVEDGRISDVSFWCTGDWDAETREHHKAEVRLLRP